MTHLIISTIVAILIAATTSLADERIFYEDYETTSYTTHFMESQFGSDTSSYWNEMISEVTQSAIAQSGSYSGNYDPYTDRNSYQQFGIGNVAYGNTSNFDLSGYNNRYWYFRYYVYWGVPDNIYSSGANKIFYLGCTGDHYYIAKTYDNQTGFVYTISDSPGGATLSSGWPSQSVSLYDQNWHKVEIYIDFGSSNEASDGSTWVQIDDGQLIAVSNLDFNYLPTPVSCVAIPSNCTGCTGSQDVKLDELEVFVLDGPLAQGDTEPSAGSTPVTGSTFTSYGATIQ